MQLLFYRLLWLVSRGPAPTMAFTSDRLGFRRYGDDDILRIRARITPTCLAEMSPWGQDLRQPKVFRAVMAYGYVIQRHGRIVGIIGFGPLGSFGIWIAPEHRALGYGSEAVKAFLMQPEFDRIIRRAGCFEDNIACRRIREGNKFIERRRVVLDSPFCDNARVAVFYSRITAIRPAPSALGGRA